MVLRPHAFIFILASALPSSGLVAHSQWRCSAGASDDSLSRALRREAQRRGGVGELDKLRRIGPHSTASPKSVVEYVVTELCSGDIKQAFTFTAMPPWKQGTHRSTTDWGQRMDWERCRVIGGACSGGVVDAESFERLVRKRYGALLDTEVYRFVGDDSAWQQKNGEEMPTAPKEYMVEIQTKRGEQLLLKFKLVYDWLVYCHLVASVTVFSWTTEKFFPGGGPLESDI